MKNHYEILGLGTDAGFEDIRKAYRKLSVKFHPDKNEGDLYFASMFRQINEAYQVLSDPAKRQAYDRQRILEQQQKQAEWDKLNQKEKELRERERRVNETNIRSQAILNETERLMNRKTDIPKAASYKSYRSGGLNQVVGIKYCLWAVIVILVYLVATKGDRSKENSDALPKTTAKHVLKHRRKHKKQTEQPVYPDTDSSEKGSAKPVDSVAVDSTSVRDTIR